MNGVSPQFHTWENRMTCGRPEGVLVCNRKKTWMERWFLTVFLGFWFVTGAFVLGTEIWTYIRYARSANWERIEAQLLSASIDIHINLDNDADACLYHADYTFTYKGQAWRGNRATVDGYGPNPRQMLRERHEKPGQPESADEEAGLFRLIEAHEQTGTWGHARAWVNPEDPSDSMLFRQWADRHRIALISAVVMMTASVLTAVIIALVQAERSRRSALSDSDKRQANMS